MRMMKGICSCAVVLLTLAGASSASAKRPPLILKYEGSEVALGSAEDGGFQLLFENHPCLKIRKGTLTANGKPTDLEKFTGVEEGACSSGTSVSGTIKQLKLANVDGTGTMTFALAVEITKGECVYDLKSLEGSFTLPGRTATPVTGVAKRDRSSAKTCATVLAVEGVGGFGPTISSTYEAEG